LKAQMPYMRVAAEAMGLAVIERDGFEADDVIATLARKAKAAGIRTTIVSSDKDFCQLVEDGWVEIVDPSSGARYMSADVRDHKFGVAPCRVPDFQALAGDAVDNIPGIDGIGNKSAAGLIRVFGTVERVVEAAAGNSPVLSASQRVALRGRLDDLLLYRTLATLRTDVPLDIDPTDLEVQPILRDVVMDLLDRLEARGRFDAIFARTPTLDRIVPKMAEDEEMFGWWQEEAMFPGQNIPDTPQCGWYMTRLVRGGPRVPARVWRDPGVDPVTGEAAPHDILRCSVGGRPRDAVALWQQLAMNPISVEEYEFEMADAAWAKQYDPSDPKAAPDRKIDPRTAPLPVFKKARKKTNGRHQSARSDRL
jgi:hypothetical protein